MLVPQDGPMSEAEEPTLPWEGTNPHSETDDPSDWKLSSTVSGLCHDPVSAGALGNF